MWSTVIFLAFYCVCLSFFYVLSTIRCSIKPNSNFQLYPYRFMIELKHFKAFSVRHTHKKWLVCRQFFSLLFFFCCSHLFMHKNSKCIQMNKQSNQSLDVNFILPAPSMSLEHVLWYHSKSASWQAEKYVIYITYVHTCNENSKKEKKKVRRCLVE